MDDSGKKNEALEPRTRFRADSLFNAVTGVGTEDDWTRYSRPNMNPVRLSTQELRRLRYSDDLVRLIIEDIVQDAMRPGVKVLDPETGELLEEGHADTCKAWHDIQEAALNGRAYGSGFLLYVTDRSFKQYAKPIKPGEKIIGQIALDPDEFSPRAYPSRPRDFESPNVRFGRPMIWDVHPNSRGARRGMSGPVHVSRLSYFWGTPLDRYARTENCEQDDSVIQSVYRSIVQFDSVETAIAQVIQRFETATISIPELNRIITSGDEDVLIDRIRLIQVTMSIINAVLVDAEGGGYDRKFANVNGLDKIWDRMALSVAKAAKMPMTKLFGMAPAGLSSDDQSGRANWAKQVAAYQREQLVPAFTQYYSLKHGRPVTVVFRDTEEPSPEIEAEIRVKETDAVIKAVATGVLTKREGRRRLEELSLAPAGFDPTVRDEDPEEDKPAPPAPEESEGVGDLPGQPTNVNRLDPLREDAKTYQAPESARNNARKVLRWREEHGDEVKGMTRTGWTRARQLAKGGKVSRDIVGRMAAFARHRKNAEVAAEFKSEPWKDAGYVAWLGWGGTSGIEWAGGILDREDED